MTTPEGYQPMASAPRDRSFIIVRLADTRSHPRRKHWEYIVRRYGVGRYWRSFTAGQVIIKDEDCVGWRPMDDEAWRVVQEHRSRQRAAAAVRRSPAT
jgi:hypothetical protein